MPVSTLICMVYLQSAEKDLEPQLSKCCGKEWHDWQHLTLGAFGGDFSLFLPSIMKDVLLESDLNVPAVKVQSLLNMDFEEFVHKDYLERC